MELELDMEVIDYQNRIVNVPRNVLARRRNNFDELNDTEFHLHSAVPIHQGELCKNFGTICPRIGTKPPLVPAWGPGTLTQAETLSRPGNLG